MSCSDCPVTQPVVFDSVLDWIRAANMVLAVICSVLILTVPESPWRNSAAGGARLLSLATCGTYLWSAFASLVAIMDRGDPLNGIPDYPVRVYGLTFWLMLTLFALAQRHIIGNLPRPPDEPHRPSIQHFEVDEGRGDADR